MVVDPEKTAAGEASEATPLLQKSGPVVSPQACYHHQLLLRCFLDLKRTISKMTGLYKKEYDYEIESEVDPIARQSTVEERRWSIYVSRAVHRFSVWWAQIPADSEMSSCESHRVSEKPYAHHSGWTWTGDELLPLGKYLGTHNWGKVAY